jgi:uncharacterized secreted protein with C-terminal beta-propeller domain
MKTLGWIILVISALIFIWILIQTIRGLLWNQKLNQYKDKHNIERIPLRRQGLLKKSYGLVLSSLLVVTVAFSGMLSGTSLPSGKTLLNAIPVESGTHLKQLIEEYNQSYYYRDAILAQGALESAAEANVEKTRDFIKTNVQVEGVDEGDIIKTDGYQIYYASRYDNQIQVLTIDDEGVAYLEETIELGDMYTDSIYLTEKYVIAIGYTYEYFPMPETELDYVYFGFVTYSGSVVIYDRDTREVAYKLETTTNFYQHRLMGDDENGYALFLVGNQNVYGDDPRPYFTEYEDGQKSSSPLGYDDIYYTPGTPIDNMTVITGIDLDDFSVNSEAFLGGVNLIYASLDAIYTTQYYWEYDLLETKNYTQIIKYDLDSNLAQVEYAGQVQVDGYIRDSYWMDEYDGYLRVVTTSSNPTINRLYVIKEDDDTDAMEIVGSITKGLGKEGEMVKSVRFNENTGHVVTFRQIDPLYRIDLTDPKNPVIVGEIEEPGFSAYLHIWNNDDHAIGFGFTADLDGRVTGMKISAYNTLTSEVLDTFELPSYDEGREGYYYSYSEASYNPKAMMISPSHMIFGFPVISYGYDYENGISTYESYYYIFRIDFDQENADDILQKPIMIASDVTENYLPIERGIYIDEIIYTFSNGQMTSYDLVSNTYLQEIEFTSK